MPRPIVNLISFEPVRAPLTRKVGRSQAPGISSDEVAHTSPSSNALGSPSQSQILKSDTLTSLSVAPTSSLESTAPSSASVARSLAAASEQPTLPSATTQLVSRSVTSVVATSRPALHTPSASSAAPSSSISLARSGIVESTSPSLSISLESPSPSTFLAASAITSPLSLPTVVSGPRTDPPAASKPIHPVVPPVASGLSDPLSSPGIATPLPPVKPVSSITTVPDLQAPSLAQTSYTFQALLTDSPAAPTPVLTSRRLDIPAPLPTSVTRWRVFCFRCCGTN